MSDDLRSFLWGGKPLTSLERERRRRRVQRTDESIEAERLRSKCGHRWEKDTGAGEHTCRYCLLCGEDEASVSHVAANMEGRS